MKNFEGPFILLTEFVVTAITASVDATASQSRQSLTRGRRASLCIGGCRAFVALWRDEVYFVPRCHELVGQVKAQQFGEEIVKMGKKGC